MKKCWLQIFFFQIFPLLCLTCHPNFWPNPGIDNKDLTWVVEIFALPLKESKSIKAIFQCAGVLIHPQAVLTTRNCMPDDNFSQNVTVRVYDWSKKSNNIIQELYVSRSYYEKYYDIDVFRINENLFTTLILEKPFSIDSQINFTDSYKLNTTIEDVCIYLDERLEKKSGVLSRKQLWLNYLPDKECCDYFGDWTVPFFNKTLQYNCTKHPSSFCSSFYSSKCSIQGRQGTPILCPSAHDGSFTLAGLLVGNTDCRYQFAKIQDIQKYINRALANVTL
ncbi:uncharacterized protein [Chelonus insularis]|uniref:uncharacterized protein n=1 Tax=Chelonus insularis TaxID=460826 RepID=UPI00158AFEE4|nr:uncharacterized protein LOC118066966 [Chelonus insularis]